MGEERGLIIGLDDGRGIRNLDTCIIPVDGDQRLVRLQPRLEGTGDIRAGQIFIRRGLPRNIEPVSQLLRLPPRVGHHDRPAGHFGHGQGTGG